MNDPQVSPDHSPTGAAEEMRSALFAQMVMQQSSMAMMLLGKTAHPETGAVVRDLEAARLFIDQLEMLEHKTKGNLTPEETALLQQSLMSLRLAFVEAVDSPPAEKEPKPDRRPAPSGSGPAPEPAQAEPAPADNPAEAEPRKRFSKKY